MDKTEKKIEISICMGSSCFIRGNNHSIQIINDYIRRHNLEDNILLKGNLCEGMCKLGPNIKINGQTHNGVDPASLEDLLNFYCGKVKR